MAPSALQRRFEASGAISRVRYSSPVISAIGASTLSRSGPFSSRSKRSKASG